MCTAAAAALCVPWLRRWRHLPRRNNASSSSLLPFPAGTDRSSPSSSNSVPLRSPSLPVSLTRFFIVVVVVDRNYVQLRAKDIRASRKKKKREIKKGGGWEESSTHAFLDTDRNFFETRSNEGAGRRRPREISSDASRNETIPLSSPLPCLALLSFQPDAFFLSLSLWDLRLVPTMLL